MKIATKILIGVMAFWCVIGSVLSIHFGTTAYNRRKDVEAERSVANDWMSQYTTVANQVETFKAASVMAKAEADRANESVGREREQRLASQARVDQAARRADEMAGRVFEFQVKNAQLAADLVDQRVRQTALLASNTKYAGTNERLHDQLAARDQRVLGLAAKLDATAQATGQLSRELEKAHAVIRTKDALLAAADDKIRELEQRLAAVRSGASRGDPVPAPAAAINGRVQAVSLADNVAELNVGAAHGVKPGMRFVLYRGAAFVGHLTITHVESNNSAGVLSDIQAPPQRLDKATTDLGVD